MTDNAVTVVPGFLCRSLEETLVFYQALGFEVTHEQTSPYWYGAVQRGEIELHFTRLKGAERASGSCLVLVPEVSPYHQAFANGLRAQYGRIPTADLPRITRLRPFHTRFQVHDPSGNVLMFINRSEPEVDYEQAGYASLSPLAQALTNAAFLRDTYANDTAAARVLDKALAKEKTAEPLERALALAARAELAVAMGDMMRFQATQRELEQIPLADEERENHRDELRAAEMLVQWITKGD